MSIIIIKQIYDPVSVVYICHWYAYKILFCMASMLIYRINLPTYKFFQLLTNRLSPRAAKQITIAHCLKRV